MARGWCKKHYYRWYHHGDPTAFNRNSPVDGYKTCTSCDQRLGIINFHKRGGVRGSELRSSCKACEKIKSRSYLRANPFLARAQGLRATGAKGATKEKLKKLFARANGKCESCSKDFRKEKHAHKNNDYEFDHNHDTGLLRGVLCKGCNMALGLLEENPNYIRKLADYIELYKDQSNAEDS